MPEHRRDTSQGLRRKDLRCGCRGGRGRVAIHEYVHPSAHTHIPTPVGTHVHTAELTFAQPHTFSYTDAHRFIMSTHKPFHAPALASTISVHRCTSRSHWHTTLSPVRATTVQIHGTVPVPHPIQGSGHPHALPRPSSRPVGPPRGPTPPPILRPPFFLGSKRDQAAPVSSAHASCVHSSAHAHACTL